ncbi:MAG: hypothetical protein JWQ20_1916 [Conexibacter sp.]|nr:hypothetical protein [Conexibacter sp.]
MAVEAAWKQAADTDKPAQGLRGSQRERRWDQGPGTGALPVDRRHMHLVGNAMTVMSRTVLVMGRAVVDTPGGGRIALVGA